MHRNINTLNAKKFTILILYLCKEACYQISQSFLNVFQTLIDYFPDIVELLIAAGILDLIEEKLGTDNKKRALLVNNNKYFRVNFRLKRQLLQHFLENFKSVQILMLINILIPDNQKAIQIVQQKQIILLQILQYTGIVQPRQIQQQFKIFFSQIIKYGDPYQLSMLFHKWGVIDEFIPLLIGFAKIRQLVLNILQAILDNQEKVKKSQQKILAMEFKARISVSLLDNTKNNRQTKRVITKIMHKYTSEK